MVVAPHMILKGASSAMSDWMGGVPERPPAGRTQRVDDEQGRAGVRG